MGQALEKAEPDASSGSFGEWLDYFLSVHGTRPGGSPSKLGSPWSKRDFAEALSTSLASVGNWLADRKVPKDLRSIERVLFGETKSYDEWRTALRAAHQRNKQNRRQLDAVDSSISKTMTASSERPSGRPFEEFCDSVIGYFSRTQYIRELSINEGRMLSEKSLLNRIVNSEVHSFLVIYGQGGRGKTRLLRHLKDLCCINYPDANLYFGIDKFGQTVNNGVGQLDIVFVDYGEKFSELEELSRIIESDSGRTVKFIITCRDSSLSRLLMLLNKRRCIVESITGGGADTDFSKWLVRKILYKSLPKSQASVFVDKCKNVPIIAAFYAYIYNRSSQNINLSDYSLVKFDNFNDWVLSRIDMALKSGPNFNDKDNYFLIWPSIIFEKFVSMPFISQEDEVDYILSYLLDDGFIVALHQDCDIQFSGAHDYISDSIISNCINSARTESGFIELKKVFQVIFSKNSSEAQLLQLISNIERVFPLITTKRAAAIIGNVVSDFAIKHKPILMLTVRSALLNSEIINDDQAVKLMRSTLISDDFANDQLSVWLVENAKTILRRIKSSGSFIDDILRFYDNAIDSQLDSYLVSKDGTPSTRLLVEGYAAFPDRYELKIHNIYQNLLSSGHWKVIYVVKELLHSSVSSGKFPQILILIQKCIKKFAHQAEDTRFIIEDWINLTKDTDSVKTLAIYWLNCRNHRAGEYVTTSGAYFIFSAWIRANGDIVPFKNYIWRWAEGNWFSERFGVYYFVRRYIFEYDKRKALSVSNLNVIIEIAWAFVRQNNRGNVKIGLSQRSVAAQLINLGLYKAADENYILKRAGIVWQADLAQHFPRNDAFSLPPIAILIIKSLIDFEGEIDPDKRRAMARGLVYWDWLIRHDVELRSQFREWIGKWLRSDDSGRKSFFDHWYRRYNVLEPFGDEAKACLAHPGNRDEILSYECVPDWVTAIDG